MSLYHPGEPSAQHKFRDVTERQQGAFLGITHIQSRILCKRCRQMRNSQTAVNGVCHHCRTKSRPRQSAKKKADIGGALTPVGRAL